MIFEFTVVFYVIYFLISLVFAIYLTYNDIESDRCVHPLLNLFAGLCFPIFILIMIYVWIYGKRWN